MSANGCDRCYISYPEGWLEKCQWHLAWEKFWAELCKWVWYFGTADR